MMDDAWLARIRGPPLKIPREARARVDRVARATKIRIARKDALADGIIQRHLIIETPRGAFEATETITPVSYAFSVRPRVPPTAGVLLSMCTQFGEPDALYEDDRAGSSDYSAEWYAVAQDALATSMRVGLRTAAGFEARAISVADLARVVLDGA